ncbi:uncharacterized protein LOC105165306 isoform X3 [Sesamum indicum]|uniref:Uncharacterized protein LOC105165306 isoform X3 n=1 Tax=Sesamum indicum TaxID=4182 RepID=A0A8M8V290_SESIN|nr:uncharacterized protein LOC105165306 isoform X3 [Sesamum indicum]
MPVKRSRAVGPSSHLFKQVATSVDAGVNPTAVIKADASGGSSQSKILNIAYPLSVGDSDRVKFGVFLERCHYCKKRIARKSEFFMCWFPPFYRALHESITGWVVMFSIYIS